MDVNDSPGPRGGLLRLGPRAAAWSGVALALALSPACRREEVSHARVPKAAPAPKPAAAPSQAPTDLGSAHAPGAAPMGAGDVPAPPTPGGGSALKWKLSKGWTQTTSGGMRFATLVAPVTGRLDVSVVVLPGPAGGELANVNRWRGQIGLPPIDEPALAAARKPLKTKAGPVSLFDFTSEGEKKSRMVAGLLASNDGNTWFVKMTGDAEPVAKARPDFLRILETLYFE